MKDLLLASRLRAALANIPNIRLDLLMICADNSTVELNGRVKSPELLDQILEIAEGMPEVETVDNKVQVDYHSYRVE